MVDWKFLGGITALGGLIGYFGAKTIDVKKLPAGEKAVLTGASTGATMEGLDLALGAESFSALDYELNRNDCCELWVEKLYNSGKIGFGEAGNLLAAIEMDGLKCSQLGGAKCNKKAESHDFSQKSAEGDYEPSFDSLKERIEWMEFAVGDENWYQYEDDYIDVVLDIEEWNENNANNSKLSNLVKRYKKRTGWMDAESFSAEQKCGNCGMMKDVLNMMPSGDTCRGCFESWSKEKQEGYDAESFSAQGKIRLGKNQKKLLDEIKWGLSNNDGDYAIVRVKTNKYCDGYPPKTIDSLHEKGLIVYLDSKGNPDIGYPQIDLNPYQIEDCKNIFVKTTDLANKNAESLKKDSCCCGATKSKPCACMIQGIMECSATCPCALEN